MLADGQRHRPAGAMDLVGELYAGGRGAHHQRAAVRELIGIPVVRGMDLLDLRRHVFAYRRDLFSAEPAASQYYRAAALLAAVGLDAVAVVGGADGGDRGACLHPGALMKSA